MIMLGHKFALGHFSDDTRGFCGFWEVVPGFRGHTQTPDQAQQSLMCAVASVHSAWSSPWVAWGSQAPWAGFGVSFSVRAAVNTRDTPGDTAGQLCFSRTAHLCSWSFSLGSAQSSSQNRLLKRFLFHTHHCSSLMLLFHFKQFKNHKEVSEEPTVALDSVFSTLLKRAYERGSNTLLEDGVQTKLRDLASLAPPDQLLLGVKHVLLYLKSTVENFSSVRAML